MTWVLAAVAVLWLVRVAVEVDAAYWRPRRVYRREDPMRERREEVLRRIRAELERLECEG